MHGKRLALGTEAAGQRRGAARRGAGPRPRHHLHVFGGLPDLAPLCRRLLTRPRGRARTLPHSFQQSEGEVHRGAGRSVPGATEQISERFPQRSPVSSLLRRQPISSIQNRHVFFAAFQTAWEMKSQHSPALHACSSPCSCWGLHSAGRSGRDQKQGAASTSPLPARLGAAVTADGVRCPAANRLQQLLPRPAALAPHPPSPGKEQPKEKNETNRKESTVSQSRGSTNTSGRGRMYSILI